MSVVIKVENLSKAYQLGEIGTGTISRDLERFWAKMRGKEDPFIKIGEVNNRSVKGESDIVWGLKDLNFEIEQGDTIGVIGRNGAGKSTLLKILSRVTSPTVGSVKIKGRIASLLEVGTGFHPELSGRENIYLNGAILGMRKAEIKRKFDEIVDFSGVERYIDTPVKRYSSGMYVRLAFGVAAHLESEILIVDEVLAVGDAEFQKKCLGKMKDVSKGEGRTVLFVSHNMVAIQNLCKKSILLVNGEIETMGETGNVISEYLAIKTKKIKVSLENTTERSGNGNFRFMHGKIKGSNLNMNDTIETFSPMQIELKFALNPSQRISASRIDIGINNYLAERVAWLSSDTKGEKLDLSTGEIQFVIDKLPLAPGDYSCNLYCEINNEVADWMTNVLEFTIIEKDYYGTGKTVPLNQGNILLDYKIQ